MRNGSSKKLIILSILVVLCLVAFYEVTKYYRNQEIKPIIRITENVNVADEINVADSSDHCVGQKKCSYSSNGWKYLGYRPSNCRSTSPPSGSCVGSYYVSCGPTGGVYHQMTQQCTACESGYTLSSGKCIAGTTKCSITGVNVEESRVSPGEAIHIRVSYEGGSCSGKRVTVSSVQNGAGGNSVTLSGTKGTSRITVAAGKTACTPAKFSVSLDGNSKTVSVAVRSNWHLIGNYVSKNKLPATEGEANAAGQDRYGTCPTLQISDGYYLCSNVHSRGCSDPVYVPPACYADNKVLSLATSAKWIRPTEIDSVHRVLVANAKSEAECKVIPAPALCEPTTKACAKDDKNTDSCTGSLTIKYDDGMSCNGQPFYSVKCDNTVTTDFNSSLGSSTSLYAGLGFSYGITITSKRSCTAEFNATNWKEAYNRINAKINQANKDLGYVSGNDKTEVEKLIYEMKGKLKDITDMVISYNNYNPSVSYNDEIATISLSYRTNNKPAEDINLSFQETVIEEGKGRYSNESVVNLGVAGVPNPSNYIWSNENNPRKIKLILPKAYLDKTKGIVGTSGLDGGNKLYIDYNTDPGTYGLNIKVSGVGCNSTINNDKCSITVKKQNILYRPIDVSNPFINNKWAPGVNWINDNFDFRKVIDPDIWSK